MSYKSISVAIVICLALAYITWAGNEKKKLTSDDKKDIIEGLDILKCAVEDKVEIELVNDIESRCELMFYFNGNTGQKMKYLTALENKRATSVIAIALKHSSIDIKYYAVQALARIKDRCVVPNILQALKENNIIVEGSEIAAAHKTLMKALVDALEILTEQEYKITEYDDEKQIDQVISRTTEWLKVQNGK